VIAGLFGRLLFSDEGIWVEQNDSFQPWLESANDDALDEEVILFAQAIVQILNIEGMI